MNYETEDLFVRDVRRLLECDSDMIKSEVSSLNPFDCVEDLDLILVEVCPNITTLQYNRVIRRIVTFFTDDGVIRALWDVRDLYKELIKAGLLEPTPQESATWR